MESPEDCNYATLRLFVAHSWKDFNDYPTDNENRLDPQISRRLQERIFQIVNKHKKGGS